MTMRRLIVQLVVVLMAASFTILGVFAAVREPKVASDRMELQRQVSLYGSDEFSGPAGSPPDKQLWSIETGEGGWGNDEQQTYTDSPDNVRLDGAGHLIIEARRVGDQITSARINSYSKMQYKRGMIEARIKMPEGQGLHPAFWMLGNSIADLGYPDCGEIDIAEVVNTGTVGHAAIHGPWISASPRPDRQWKRSAEYPAPVNLSDDFHVYWMRSEADEIAIGIDDTQYARFLRKDIPEGARWVQDYPFFVVLNMAVGGEWPGPVADESLPAQMIVDWVRVYG